MSDAPPKSGEYQDGKFWFTRKGSTVTVGITDHAVVEIGSVLSVEFPTEGADFQRGEILISVNGETGRLDVPAPAGGTVKELNDACSEEPTMISDDPLEEGWLAKIEIEDPTELNETLEQDSEEGDDDSDEEEDSDDEE